MASNPFAMASMDFSCKVRRSSMAALESVADFRSAALAERISADRAAQGGCGDQQGFIARIVGRLAQGPRRIARCQADISQFGLKLTHDATVPVRARSSRWIISSRPAIAEDGFDLLTLLARDLFGIAGVVSDQSRRDFAALLGRAPPPHRHARNARRSGECRRGASSCRHSTRGPRQHPRSAHLAVSTHPRSSVYVPARAWCWRESVWRAHLRQSPSADDGSRPL